MTNEQLSITLEVVGFFLVTTDLYGEERLSRLSNRLDAAVSGAPGFMRRAVGQYLLLFKPDRLSVIPSLTVLVFAVIDYIYIFAVTGAYLAHYVNLIVNVLIVLMSPIILMIVLMSGGWFLLLFGGLAIIFVARQFVRLRVSGWMLLVGSTLFIVSKALVFFGAPTH
jgi:hypothetical protein